MLLYSECSCSIETKKLPECFNIETWLNSVSLFYHLMEFIKVPYFKNTSMHSKD